LRGVGVKLFVIKPILIVIATLKQNLPTIIINVITCLVMAFALEGLLALGLNHPSSIPKFLLRPFQEYYLYNDRSIIQVTGCAEYHPELFYILKPGTCQFKNREFEVELVTNSDGLRDSEKASSNSPVVALGDSYTLGWGVGQDEAFPQVLERLTHAGVLNAAQSSYGTAREMILFNRLSMDSVKTLILQYHTNDYEENIKFLDNNYKLPIRKEASYDSLKESIRARQRYYPFKHLYGISKGISRKFMGVKVKSPTPTEEAVAFLEVLKESSPPVQRIIVFQIAEYEKLNDEFVNAVDSLAQLEAYRNIPIETLRITGALNREDYFILDDHINASGHSKLASRIYDQLEKSPKQ
jgi:lysophospholipase L1-like esterase